MYRLPRNSSAEEPQVSLEMTTWYRSAVPDGLELFSNHDRAACSVVSSTVEEFFDTW